MVISDGSEGALPGGGDFGAPGQAALSIEQVTQFIEPLTTVGRRVRWSGYCTDRSVLHTGCHGSSQHFGVDDGLERGGLPPGGRLNEATLVHPARRPELVHDG
jgi:hypothetical protein